VAVDDVAGATTLTPTRGGVGTSVLRPDGVPKVEGAFQFSSDLWAEGMLWGATLRSPHPHARIVAIDVAPAWQIAGVRAVLTADDVPGRNAYGLEHADQPVFASDVVRYQGEAIAAVAADHPDTARRAVAAIVVEWEVLPARTDPVAAIERPEGVFRHVPIRRGDASVVGDVVIEGEYEMGMQDQAFLGPESGLAIPDDGGGGVELYISTQWLHVDRDQVAAALDLPIDRVRLVLAGVGGAFGAREDVSLQIHVCLLALRTGRPVKMVYSREESFFGHVHRHPARITYRHHATADGRLVKVEARIVLDGGAYLSSSNAVCSNAATFAVGPYACDTVVIDAYAARTNNPPCGAMRGFGVVQACFAHEAQMDRLADACGIEPLEIRLRNALLPGGRMPTGQVITGALPTLDCLQRLAALPYPEPLRDDQPQMALPGGAGRTALVGDVRRGIGWAVSIKNLMFSEGFDDYSTAACRLADGVATITCACAEVGQGFVTLMGQIARTILGVDEVLLEPSATATIGSAGSTSASRQTWMSGGAVEAACIAVRAALLTDVASQYGVAPAALQVLDGRIVSDDGTVDVSVADATAGRVLHEVREHHHAPTTPLDADGQGDSCVSFAIAAHRAVVDVDPELGLVKVVQLATVQDVGRALNPLAVIGQIEGGCAQGLGLAVMEEIVVDDGRIRNASFTDYLIPTMLDMPPVAIELVEEAEPGAPFGAKGVGEPPTISSTPAVIAAIRAATGRPLTRAPVRPQDIVGAPAV
jgi:xanthine dehydrogenase D subunit